MLKEFEDGDLMQQQGKFELYVQKPLVTEDWNHKRLRRIWVHERRCEEQRGDVLGYFQ